MELKKKGEISEQCYQDNRSCGAQIAKLYGLAKVHKTGIRMRPIVSLPGTCHQHLAKKLSDILSKVPACNIETKPNLVAQQLSQIQLPEGAELVSLDVTSLCAMVPVDEATEFAALKTNELGLLPDCMAVETFLFLLRPCVKDVLFASPGGRLYRKVDGVAMGSALGPYVANLLMAQFDDAIAGLPFDFRYVDDIIPAFPTSNVGLLQKVNTLTPSLQFAREFE